MKGVGVRVGVVEEGWVSVGGWLRVEGGGRVGVGVGEGGGWLGVGGGGGRVWVGGGGRVLGVQEGCV